MNKTKEAISNFMSKAGHHDTTVHESVNPAVQHETIKPTQHEEVNTAVDKEVHQDHYHHTVQPVQDKEILAEQHHHNIGQAEHRHYDNRDDSKVKRALETEAAKFKDESRRTETTHTQSHAPVVQGEHVHHHVHETYQPVIHKETVEPHVVHTTVPIHETHHNAAKHHATSTLPPVNMAEFSKHGGTRVGGQHEHHQFDGCPDVDGGEHSHNKGLSNIMSSGRTHGTSSSSSSDYSGTGTNLGSQGQSQSAAATAAASAMGGKSHRHHDSAKGLENFESGNSGNVQTGTRGNSVFDKVNSAR